MQRDQPIGERLATDEQRLEGIEERRLTRALALEPGWTPYCVDVERRQMLLVEIPPEADLSRAPFVFLMQERLARRALVVPFAALGALGEAVAAPRRLIFVFGIGRDIEAEMRGRETARRRSAGSDRRCAGLRGSGDLAGREDHVHVAALLLRCLLDGREIAEVLVEAVEQRPAALRVGLLATAEHDRHLDLVLLVEEALDVALLGLVVVVGDLRAQLDLADVDLLLVLARLLGLLLLLVLVLRVVEQAADRRARVRRDLDQVEIGLAGDPAGLVGVDDPDLLAVGADQADLRNADALVDASRVPVRGTPIEASRDRH